MGTKIEYAINPLGITSQNCKRFTVHGVNDWEFYLQNSGVKDGKYLSRTGLENKIFKSTDRMLDKYNVDSIKKTMQMQEDIFKHQVRELHRLYSVQKMLMDELKEEVKQRKVWDPMTSTDISTSQLINWQQPAIKLVPGASLHIQSLRDDLNSRECSGSCSGDTVRISRGFDLERPAAEEDISTGVSAVNKDQGGRGSNVAITSSKMSINGTDEDSDVELTLSIGSSTSKKGSKANNNKDMKALDSSAMFKSDRGGECSDPTTPMGGSNATFDQKRKQPHWLFHSLKLK